MLDRKYIVANAEEIKKNCLNRGVTCDVDKLVELDGRLRKRQHETE
ncbi:MAG: serine--tRNA ligase, partial [Planctomycetota bacterium]|nr:serine--tRNA ligase [Planctomycetota bacterium]